MRDPDTNIILVRSVLWYNQIQVKIHLSLIEIVAKNKWK